MQTFEPVLLRNRGVPNSWEIDTYLARGGYNALRKALAEHTPDDIVALVKASGLRGRGGAGFTTGMKWSFIPKSDPTKGAIQKYLVCNGDESEPGTFNNRELIETDPHQLIEGIAISAYATGCSRALVYCRGEFAFGADRIERAVAQAKERGFLGPKGFRR